MQAGNIVPKTTIRMNYLNGSTLPFESSHAKEIIIRPHQTPSVEKLDNRFTLPDLNCSSSEVNCVCVEHNRKSYLIASLTSQD